MTAVPREALPGARGPLAPGAAVRDTTDGVGERPREPRVTPVADDGSLRRGDTESRRQGDDGSLRRGAAAEAPRRPGGTSPDMPPRFPDLRAPSSDAPLNPPPPKASSRFPDAPPSAGQGVRQDRTGQSATPPRRNGAPPETASETTFRLRPFAPTPVDARPSDRPTSSGAPTGVPARPAGDEGARGGGRPFAAPGAGPSGPGVSSGVPAGASPRPDSRPADGFGRGGAVGGSGVLGGGRSSGGAVGGPPEPGVRAGGVPVEPFTRAAAPADAPSRPQPDPSLSWSAPLTPGETHGSGRPVVSFGEPEGYDEQARPRPIGRRSRMRTAAVAVCLVLGLGLIGGAVTGSWLVGDSAAAGGRDTFAAASGMWHSVPVDQLFPPTVQGQGAGPGGADRTWTRIAVAPDSGCKDAFDPLLLKALAPVGCQRLLRATYTDATQSYVTTVGLLFTKADATAMTALDTRFDKENLDRRADLMPRTYPAKDTVAADFGTEQRASWAISVLTDAPVVAFAVSGWADGRTVDEPQPAEEAMESGATTAVAQAGLGNEAQGLTDRIERGFRRTVSSATEKPS
ncbi:hypothetical protein [Streptomyces sp. S.PB5]|uniref:hypothetical protein n=1 Tax=Streptomyces sp. S.PB5 TaxID=3020844 RepID=UPI0025B0E65F|nr:hypothetical protein [Streptomyces sp. S.PB5]MDN3022269.1 hypothetical protein [Streptomyces sp. S.PB5]